MKASDLKKVSISIETLYGIIENENKENRNKHLVPFGIYVSNEVQSQLMMDGFKLTFNDVGCLIIEW